MLCEDSLSSSSIDSCNSPTSVISSESSVIEQPTYEDVALTKILNKAKFPVFLGHSPSHGEQFAVKLFPYTGNKMNPCFLNEAQFAALRHENVIQILHYETDREAMFDDGAKKISYTVMELAPYGDFYDVVMSQKVHINDKLARTYFHQLIEGIQYMHSVGVAHLDLKLDNLLLGQNFTLKIGDFDQAYVRGQKHILSKGTVCYRAPELVLRTCKNPEAADVYSAGIILFLLKCGGVLPHSEQQTFRGLNLFDLMINNPSMFWEKHCEIQGKSSSFFDEDFKALYNAMVRFNPDERVTLEQIKSSRWYNGEVYSPEELIHIMKKHF